MAWFGASHRTAVALLTLSRMYHFNLYPAVARRAGQEAVEMRRLVTASFRVSAWAGILAALVLTLLARPLLVLAFGKHFAVAAPTFAILVWMLPIELLSGHARWTLIATGQQRYVLRAHVAGLATSLLVGAALIPALQSVGAAVALLAASFAVWGVAHAYAVARLGHVVRLWVALVMGLVAPRLATDPLVATAIAATGYTLCALLVDRRLLADLRHLADAKSDPRP
jgi:O-antigen/teichoic acid export membrane protein